MSGQRKDQHVDLASTQHAGGDAINDFDEVRFVHHALAGIDRSRVTLGTSFAGIDWPAPLYVNGMTGGSERTGEINRMLAIAARETGIPIASGSMSICFQDPETIPSFRVLRSENPDGFVMANLSADADEDRALRAIEILEADALQLHVNSVQETVMPEGSRGFSAWADRIAAIVRRVEVPVIVKEVGFGLSRETLELLAELGVTVADVSGSGGTDFARIENARRDEQDLAYLEGWGQSTAQCLVDATRPATVPATVLATTPGSSAERPIPELLASGGVRGPLDVIRALALGARAVGISGVFLRTVLRGGEGALIKQIDDWLEQIAQLQALLGAETPGALTRTDLVLSGAVREFAELRGVNSAAFSRRGAEAKRSTEGAG